METLVLRLDDFVVFDSGVSGSFYLMVGQTAFPEDDWFDMVEVNLKQWIPRITSFACEHSDRCVLEFMDGPCCAVLTRDHPKVYVQGYWYGKEVLPLQQIDLNEFLASVIHAVHQYNQFTQIKYFSKQLELLKNCIDLGE